MVCFGVTEMTF